MFSLFNVLNVLLHKKKPIKERVIYYSQQKRSNL